MHLGVLIVEVCTLENQAPKTLPVPSFLVPACPSKICHDACRLDLAERIKAPFRSGTQRSSFAAAAADMAAQADSQDVPLTFQVEPLHLLTRSCDF